MYENGRVIAFFALSKDALILNNVDRKNLHREGKDSALVSSDEDEDKFWSQEKYPAIEIDYLAVCEEKRKEEGEHLGTALVSEIEMMASGDKLSATKFITVEALSTREYSAVDFYKKCGFELSEKGIDKNNYAMIYGEEPTTKRMYKIIIPK